MQNDWSKHLADRWGLALCRVDADLERQVAPYQPMRRLYRRLCHDPDVLFFPPGFGAILFIHGVIFHVSSQQTALTVWTWPLFLVFWFFVSAVLGLLLDSLLWPIAFILYKMLEGLCWFFDAYSEHYWGNENKKHTKKTP